MKTKNTYVILGIFMCFLVFYLFLPKQVLRNRYLYKNLGGRYEYYFHSMIPSDVYTPQIGIPIDIGLDDITGSSVFTATYMGIYSIGFCFKNFPIADIQINQDSYIEVIINTEINGKDISKRFYKHPLRKQVSGGGYWTLFDFNCPNEIPLDKPVTYQFKIIKGDAKLVKKYGIPRLFMSRNLGF